MGKGCPKPPSQLVELPPVLTGSFVTRGARDGSGPVAHVWESRLVGRWEVRG